MLNVELIQKVKKHILEEPKRLNMHCYLTKLGGPKYDYPPCGTIACICGWTHLLSGSDSCSNEYLAAYFLGISTYNFHRIFHVSCWPHYFSCKLKRTSVGTQAYAEVVAEFIDWLCENYTLLDKSFSVWSSSKL